MSLGKKPLVLIILDGWGYREETSYNAIFAANTPNWDTLWQSHPHTLISGSGIDVGLPEGQMGNSEVGHLNMGAGRIIPQDLVRIDQEIANGEFFKNPLLNSCLETALKKNVKVHIIGLLSSGGVHSKEQHIHALIQLAAQKGLKEVFVHAILDGRDTPPRSALSSIAALEKTFKTQQCGRTVSITGRYYAMDRDHRWERTQKAYDLYTLGNTEFHFDNAAVALEMAYERDENDEFVQPTSIHDKQEKPITIDDDDVVIIMNFRADRVRQLSRAFIKTHFDHFARAKQPKLSEFVTLTSYANDIKSQVAYPPLVLTNVFGEYIAKKGLTQLRMAETEKYAHVTFFFNGGEETLFTGEERILIPSPKVATYDLKPEMSAPELTERLIKAILDQTFDIIICNYANPDMVGHTGKMSATIKAIEVIDECIGKIWQALKQVNGEMIITSDHGNAELMYDPKTSQPHTAHTTQKIPFLYVGRPTEITHQDGNLADIAPTLLYLLGIEKPKEMTGKSLLRIRNSS